MNTVVATNFGWSLNIFGWEVDKAETAFAIIIPSSLKIWNYHP